MSTIVYYSMGIAFFASLTIYFGYKHRYHYLRFFPLFLGITAILQGIGVFMGQRGENNVVLYNFLVPSEFCFYFFTLYLMVQNKLAKKIIAFVPFVFAVLVALNLIFLQKLLVFNTMSYAVGAFLTVTICIYYFLELFQLSQPVNVATLPAFWICAGLLFFYACTFPLLGLINFVSSAPMLIRRNLGTILSLLNILLYSSFTIAFLCRIRARSSTS